MFGETSIESPAFPSSPWEDLVAGEQAILSPSPLSLSSLTLHDTGDGSNNSSPGSDSGASVVSRHLEMPYLEGDNVKSTPVITPRLIPESEEGNVEYKLKLIAPSGPRFIRLVTQLNYRLLEGGGQALYEIGVSDDGQLVGLSRADLDASLETLTRMATELGATVTVLKEIEIPPGVEHSVRMRQFACANPLPFSRPNNKKKPVVVQDSGVDLSLDPNPSPTSLDNKPIIRTYPYGQRPYPSSTPPEGSGELSTTTLGGHQPGTFTKAMPDDFDADEDNTTSDDPTFAFDLDIAQFSTLPNAQDSSVTPLISTDLATFGMESSLPKRKKPIVLPPPKVDPFAKALQRRTRRDAKRNTVRQDSLLREVTELSDATPVIVLEDTALRIPEGDDPGVSDSPPLTPDVSDNTQPMLMAEVLVSRKVTLEESFLDFGGFGAL